MQVTNHSSFFRTTLKVALGAIATFGLISSTAIAENEFSQRKVPLSELPQGEVITEKHLQGARASMKGVSSVEDVIAETADSTVEKGALRDTEEHGKDNHSNVDSHLEEDAHAVILGSDSHTDSHLAGEHTQGDHGQSEHAAGGGHDDSHGGHGNPSISTLFWPAVNFLIFAFLLNYGYRKAGKPALVSHSVQVRDDLNKAATTLVDAESALEAALARRASLEVEKKEIVERLRAEGKKIATNTLADANRQVAMISTDTTRRISGEFSKARSELRRGVVQKASDLAREELSRELSPEQDAELRRSAIMSVVN